MLLNPWPVPTHLRNRGESILGLGLTASGVCPGVSVPRPPPPGGGGQARIAAFISPKSGRFRNRRQWVRAVLAAMSSHRPICAKLIPERRQTATWPCPGRQLPAPGVCLGPDADYVPAGVAGGTVGEIDRRLLLRRAWPIWAAEHPGCKRCSLVPPKRLAVGPVVCHLLTPEVTPP